MHNEYPEEFVDSVIKPLRSIYPSSDKIDQGTVTIPYVKGISEKFRHTGNCFSLRYSIPCDCGKCYISETSRLKERKVMHIEPNTTYCKYKESAYISLVDHPISQPSLDISHVRTPIITAEVKKLQLCTV
ncbi:hypothetical protein B7P43_G14173 [Cryptotermes secundus]|uniref:Uncharacterized protein n=1 Tax=Cryptotermes secundus TaxID=105785 RepID=A0A2J7RPE7_9NEOP|nr:hypothetical protein B7P43_G14173 [Cryptotermes secundus]